MPKITIQRNSKSIIILPKTKKNAIQKTILDFFKPKDFKNEKDLGLTQKMITQFFRPKHSPKKWDPLTRQIDAKLVLLINDYNKKRDLSKENDFRKEFKKKHRTLPEHRTYWKGYMFSTHDFYEYQVRTMLSRTDKTLLYPAGTVVATATIDDTSALEHIEVKESFRRQKIGSKLIKFISERAEKFMVFSGKQYNSRYRLTEEGAKLIKFCETKRILESSQVIMAGRQSPSLEYEE